MHKDPDCLEREIIAKSKLFEIERLSLKFSNGASRVYERLSCEGLAAVLVVPLLDDHHFLLVKEYACGTERYELGFPKGLLEKGESVTEAANRELMEEVGMGARKIERLTALSSSPSYFGLMVDVVVASDLYDKKLIGDEPEPIEVVKWSFDNIDELLARDDFTEARSIATLFMVKRYLEKKHGK